MTEAESKGPIDNVFVNPDSTPSIQKQGKNQQQPVQTNITTEKLTEVKLQRHNNSYPIQFPFKIFYPSNSS